MTEIRLARHKGYCFGVKRAIEMVEKALKEGPYPIWTLGPIIHNPVVIEELCKRGVRMAEDLSQVSSGTLILRTHGTTAEERGRFSPEIDKVIDATCPFVTRAQKKAREFSSSGKKVLIIGDKNHPEVKAILSYAGAGALCAGQPSDIDAMPREEFDGNIEVMFQTTSRKEDVEKILKTLKKKVFRLVYRILSAQLLKKGKRLQGNWPENVILFL